MRVIVLTIMAVSIGVFPAFAQHDHGGHTSQPQPADTTQRASGEVPMEVPHEMHAQMPSSLLPTVPMQRDASGTAWLPDASAAHAIHLDTPGWKWMFHGTAFLRVTAQDAFRAGRRSETAFSAPNWMMVMGRRRIGHHTQMAVRGMFSLDAATEGGRGYPLLFQTGESFEGEPLVDRQHPHDLVSELAASFGQGYEDGVGYFLYFGLPGEPALGPPAFMHRPSAQHNPDSPLSHHWQDAAHITFGVATAGLRMGMFKFDGSVFTGREPDDNRYDFDKPRFDSYSGRIGVNPSSHWAMQVSGGYLKSPEWLEPELDAYRYTGSIIYQLQLRGIGSWANSVVYGMNMPVEPGGDEGETRIHDAQHSVLLESDLERSNHAFYTRVEFVQKAGHDLGMHEDDEERLFNIGAMTLGAARDLVDWGQLKLMLGGQTTLYSVPPALEPEYGGFPVSAQVYLRISPQRIL